MPIYELGYRHWEGRRVRPQWRWLAITRAEVGIALRSSKLLRRFIFMAWMPLLYFGPLFFAVGAVADPNSDISQSRFWGEMLEEFFSRQIVEQLRAHPEVFLPVLWSSVFFFYFAMVQSILAMVVVAIVAPPLISRDVRSKAFLLYFSKPIGFWDYFLGKFCVILFFIFCIAFFPALLLYAISVGFSPSFTTTFETAFIVVRILLASLVIAVPTAAVALLISSLTKDRRIATFGWVALWVMGLLTYLALTEGGSSSQEAAAADWAYVFSMRDLTFLATSAIFDVTGHITQAAMQLQEMGIDPVELGGSLHLDGSLGEQVNGAIAAASDPGAAEGFGRPMIALLCLVGITVASVFFVRRRISRPVRI